MFFHVGGSRCFLERYCVKMFGPYHPDLRRRLRLQSVVVVVVVCLAASNLSCVYTAENYSWILLFSLFKILTLTVIAQWTNFLVGLFHVVVAVDQTQSVAHLIIRITRDGEPELVLVEPLTVVWFLVSSENSCGNILSGLLPYYKVDAAKFNVMRYFFYLQYFYFGWTIVSCQNT